jgi:hypothetical protein
MPRLSGYYFCFGRSRVEISDRKPAIQTVFVGFISPLKQIAGLYVQSDHNSFLPHLLQIIIHESSHYARLYKPSYRNHR